MGYRLLKMAGVYPAISIDLKIDLQTNTLQTTQLVTSLVTIEEMVLGAIIFKEPWRTTPPQ